MSTAAKAEVFRKMNTEGNLLLPNAWDAASARVPSDGATGPLRERINLHRREKAVGRGEIKVEVDRQHDGVTPAARESTGVPASAVR